MVDPGELVLDSFAGSGTTGHAVLRLNQHMKKPVRFILVELDDEVAQTKTRERVRKAIEGYTPLAAKIAYRSKGWKAASSSVASPLSRYSMPKAR